MLNWECYIKKSAAIVTAIIAGGLILMPPAISTAQDSHDHGAGSKKGDQSEMMDHSMHNTVDQHSSEMKTGAMQDKSAGSHVISEGSIRHSHLFVLATCPVDGVALADAENPVAIIHEGQPIRFDSEACKMKFEANPAEYLKKINDQVIAAQKDSYPLDNCVVSGEKLGGEMGDPIDYVHNGTRLVRFCCKGCIGKFQKDPDKYLDKIDTAVVSSQIEDYPLSNCVVMGENKLVDEEAINYVYGTQLVRFCCKDCVQDFEKSPEKYLGKINAAAKNHKDNTTMPEHDKVMPMNHDQNSGHSH